MIILFYIYINMSEYIYPINNFQAGIDESNRGGLIGDVVAACVVLKKPETDNELNIYKQIKDSKKLTKKKRIISFIWIKENSLTYGIGIATKDEIDSINILNATMKAMHRNQILLIKNTNLKNYLSMDHILIHIFHRVKIQNLYYTNVLIKEILYILVLQQHLF